MKRYRILLTILAFVTGALLIAIGISNGEIGVVLTKAINICLECIGIG